jgi:hypothetical protein
MLAAAAGSNQVYWKLNHNHKHASDSWMKLSKAHAGYNWHQLQRGPDKHELNHNSNQLEDTTEQATDFKKWIQSLQWRVAGFAKLFDAN